MKRLLLLAGAMVAVAPLTVTAAVASTGGGGVASSSAVPTIGSVLCPDDLVANLLPVARSAAGRPVREPVLRNGPSDSEIGGGGPKTSASFGATVPVYFH